MFEEIEKGSEILHVFNQFEPPITLESIPRILKELTIHFTYDFAAAVSCFKTKSNKNDLYDVLNHSNISFESFKKRLGNFLLEKLYQTEGYEGGIAQLIEDTRYRQEHESEEYQYQDQHQEQLQDPSHMSILENQLTPKTRKSTWISDKLDASLSEISMIFNNNVNNISGLIDIRICREIIKEIFEILKLNFSKNELLKLNIFIDKKYPPKKIDDTLLFEIKPEAIEELKKLGIDPTVVFPKINLEELIGLIES